MNIGNNIARLYRTGRRAAMGALGFLALLLLSAVAGKAASIRNVQTGEIAVAATTQNVTIAAVDPTKSFLIFNERNNLASPDQASVRGNILNATTIQFAKTSATGSVTVRWFVAEFDSGATVQRGSSALATTTVNQAITSVNLAESFVLTSKVAIDATFSSNEFSRSRLTTATNLEFATNAGTGGTADWQVVSIPGASVQRNATPLAMASATATVTAAITAVDLTRSFLLFSYNSASGTATNISQKMLRGRFSSATQLEFTRDNTGSAISIAWEVVQLPVGNTVQSAIASMTGATLQSDLTVAAANLTRSVAFSGNQSLFGQSWGRTTFLTTDNPGHSSFTFNLLNATTLRLNRDVSGSTSSASYFLVDFARANQAPVLATIGSQTVNEGANLSVGVSASDPDGTIPVLTTTPLPANATFTDNTNGTGSFSFNPSFAQAGSINVTFYASDGTAIDSEQVLITVNNVNQKPLMTAIPPQTVNEGAVLTLPVSATDPDGTTPILTTSLPRPTNSGFVDNLNGTGTFTFSPNFTQAGGYSVTFYASDGLLVDSQVVPITVNNVNQKPLMTAIPPQTVNEGAVLTLPVSASDPDGTTPILTTSLPRPTNSGFVDNLNGTGTFTFSPNFTQAGGYSVTFYASDGLLVDSQVVPITVNNVNQKPLMTAIPPQTVNEGSVLTLPVSATDPDGTTPILTTSLPRPTNSGFVDNLNGTGTFTFSPNFTQAGGYSVTFYASDGLLLDSQVVPITVVEAGNQAPVLATIGSQTVNEGANLSVGVSASDPDGTIPVLTTTPLPANATFTDNTNGTGSFSFNPSFAQAGSINVTFYASDGTAIDSEQVLITVNNVNQKPLMTVISPQTVNEGAVLTLPVSASDPDGTTPILTTSLPRPTNSGFVDNLNGTGTFTFSPNFTQAGGYSVTFYASDGLLVDSQVVPITVNNVNQKPLMTVIPPQTVNEGALLTLPVSASDPDGTTPTLTTSVPLPTNSGFVDNLNGTGTFTFSPNFTQAGGYSVTFYASDGLLLDSQVVPITVNNVNQKPLMTVISPQTVNEGSVLTLPVSATDPDGTTPILTTSLPRPTNSGFVDNLNGTGTFTFSPNFTQAGGYSVTFYASDGLLVDSQVVPITVNNVNQKPLMTAIPPQTVNEGALLTLPVSASDPDGTTPILTTSLPRPTNSGFVDNLNGTGTFTFSPNFTQAGGYSVTFYASDGLLADSQVVPITVNNVNQKPLMTAIPPQTVNEGSVLTLPVSASDPDGTTPTLTTSLPRPTNSGFVDNLNGTGTFTFSPNFTQAGGYSVTFYASDGLLLDSQVVPITVSNVNQKPLMTAIPPQTVSEGSVLTLPVSASDPDGTTPILTTSLPRPTNSGFVDNLNGTGTFTFSPNFTQAGGYSVTFYASDGLLLDSQVVPITVNNVNQKPLMTAIPPQTVNEGAVLTLPVSASDPDGTTPTLTTSLPLPTNSGFVDNLNGTGTFTFSPNFTQAGGYSVTFYASDGLLLDSQVVPITVVEAGNQAPVLATIGSQAVNEGANLSVGVSASDPDGTIPVLTTTPLPANATFTDNANGTGSFSFNPSFAQAGSINVTFYASDGTAIDSEQVLITVNNVNQKPLMTVISPQTVNEGSVLTLPVSATDPDGTTPILTTSLPRPTNSGFVDNLNGTGTFTFSPNFTQAGGYSVTFYASDGLLVDSQVVPITVNNVNQKPLMTAIPPQTVNEGALLTLPVSASDPDGTTPTLTTSVPLPTNSGFVDNLNGTGTFTFSPNFTQAGGYSVTFYASDGLLLDSQVVPITVNGVNQKPLMTAIPPQTINEGAVLTLPVSATDPDGTTPTLTTSVPLPTNSRFVDNLNGTGTFTFSPNFTQAGGYSVTFYASDGLLLDSQVVPITVNNVNQKPLMTAIPPQTINEGAVLTLPVSASDPDGTTPTLTTSLPRPTNSGFVDNLNGTGTFTFSPNFTQAGGYSVTFYASDGLLLDSQVVPITVSNVNQKPLMTAIPPQTVNEGAVLTLPVSASDPDGTTPTLTTSVPLPTNSGFVDNLNGTGTFTFSPNFAQAGGYSVTFYASDGLLLDSQVVPITVNNVNQKPLMTVIPPQTVNEGSVLTLPVSATDPDGTTPTLTTSLPRPTNSGFVDNLNGTGTFTFSPNFTQAGGYSVTFYASDGLLLDSQVVPITVNNVNQKPLMTAIPPQTVNEGAVLTLPVSASDPDGTTPTLTTSLPLPTNSGFVDNLNGTGTFTFSPNFTQAGGYSVTFYASDGLLVDSQVVPITVNNVNQKPLMTAIPPQTVNEGAVLTLPVSASDPDGTTPTLTTSLPRPTNSGFVDNLNGTGTFTFSPNFTQAGGYSVTFYASDGLLIDSQVVPITVGQVNLPPVLSAIGNKSITEGVNLNFVVSASDPDATVPTLTVSTLPIGASFADNLNGTGTFNWTPTFNRAGSFNVTFYAHDASTAVDSEVVIVTVLESGNHAPLLATVGNKTITEGVALAFQVSAVDPDSTTPSFTTTVLPLGAAFVDNGNGTGSFNWTPGFTQAGPYNVTFYASDGLVLDSERISINVFESGNQPPVLAAVGNRSTTEGIVLTFGVTATDPDGTTPVLATSTLPSGATFVNSGGGVGTFSWTPGFAQAGAYPITFRATDGVAIDSEAIVITVAEGGNQVPVLVTIGNRSVTEGASLTFGVSASDADGTIPFFTTSTLPSGASFVDNGNGTGSFSWTPLFTQAGVYPVTFRATDGVSVDSETITITVNEAGNQFPVLATVGNRSTAEGVVLTFGVSATDPDGTIPSFTTSTLPTGVSFIDNGNGTGTFSWTPLFTQAGLYPVTFRASDGAAVDSETVTITVSEAGNQTPVLATVGNRSTTEGIVLTFDVSATDPDGTTPALTTSTLPAGASFTNNGNGTGTFSWTPNFVQSGTYPVTFRATDGVAADTETITITVVDVGNQSPLLTTIGNRSVTEGVNLTFSISASDPDGTIPSFTTSTLPSGASFIDNGNGTGTFSWTPLFTQAGLYPVTFRASDGVAVDSETVTMTVNEAGNQFPVLATVGNRSITEGLVLTFGVSASDPDGTIPSFTTSTLPAGALFANNGDGTGTFNWTPSFVQAGAYPVTFRATDGLATDSETIVITVGDAGNQTPILAAIGNRSTTEGVILTFNVTATDPDGTTPTFTTSTLPLGATFVNNGGGTGTFSWTPGFAQAGAYPMTFRATDGVAVDSEAIVLTVAESGNQAPVLAAIGNRSITEGLVLTIGVSSTDPDGTVPTFTTSTLPSGAIFTDNGNGTGSLNWTPSFTQSGSYPVTFRASDGVLIDTETIVISVLDAGNQFPVLATVGNRSTSEGVVLTFGVSATDPDGTVPSFTTSTLPAGALFTNNGDGTGTFNWTPSFVQAGTYPVTFRATDGLAIDSETIVITVGDAGNQTPVLAVIGNRSVAEGAILTFTISASDADGTIPSFTTSTLPTGALFTNNGNGTGTFSWTPNFVQAGTYPVTFRATDGVATDSESIVITVTESGNQPPVLATIGNRSITEGILLTIGLSSTDPDGTTPSFTTSTLPTGAAFIDNGNGTATFNWTPGFTQAGTYDVTFRTSDGALIDTEVVTITVIDAGNRAPVLAAIGSRSTTEGILLSFGTSATDPDGTIPSLSTGLLPSGATFTDNGNGTGSFSWTPSFVQSGGYSVVFRAFDGALVDTEIVTINVIEAGNRAPVIAPVGPQSTTEGLVLSITVNASDPDGTAPVLSTSTLPRGASFADNGNGNGNLTWTPDFVQSGTYNVSFFATDGILRDTEAIVITIIDARNQLPVLASIGPRSITEGLALTVNVGATDAEGRPPVLSTGVLPNGASFVDHNNGTGTLTWTPTFNRAGLYPVTFRATDDSLAIDSEVVTVTVIDGGNQPPILATIGNRSALENVNLSFGVTAADPDSTIPALTTTLLPVGATFSDNGNGTGTFSWTPSFVQAGSYPMMFYASDGVAIDSERIVITVTEAGNQAPVLATIGPRLTTEGIRLTFNISAADPDGTTPSFTTSSLPSGASFVDNNNGSGTFDWIPTYIQAGSYSIVFRTTDGGLTDTEIVSIDIIEAGNQPPVLAAIGSRTVYENRTLTVNASASDPDATIPTLSTSLLPLGATFVDNLNGTGTLSWIPGFTQAASYLVTFYASDGILRDSEVVVVTVLNANAPPVLAAIGSKSVAEATNLNFGISATDIDATIPVLTTSLLPTGATFVNNLNGTGTFNWTPSLAQSGVYNVTFYARDDSTAVDSEVVQITVGNVNQPPVLAAIGPQTVAEGLNLSFAASATDGDGTIPTLTTSALPLGASFVDNGAGTGAFSWTPIFSQSGTYNVTFFASDGVDTDSERVVITVNQVNLPPVLAAIGPQSLAENTNLNLTIAATDPDATFPLLTSTVLPVGATFTDHGNGTASFNWTPTYSQSGLYHVTFYAADGQYIDSEVVDITVSNANRAPVANAGPDQIAVPVNSTVLLDGTLSSDPDAQPVTYAWTQVSGAAVTLANSTTATPSFVPPLPDSYRFQLIVSDGALFSVPDTVQIGAINAAPPKAIADLSIAILADNIALNWTPITLDTANVPTQVGGYIIYRDTTAYFTPTTFDSIGAVSAGFTTFTDNNIFGANVVGDTLNQYFYVVLSYDIYGNRSAVSNRVGEYDYQIVTTASTNFNLICVPFENTGITNAVQLISAIGVSNVRTVNNYRPTSQSFESRFAAGFGVNFAVTPGGVYQVNAALPTIFSVAGRVPAPGAISYPMITTAATDYGFLSVPFDRESTFRTAQDVLNNVPGGFNTLNKYVAASQSYQSRFAAGFGVNFTVKAGRPYQANNARNDVFPH